MKRLLLCLLFVLLLASCDTSDQCVTLQIEIEPAQWESIKENADYILIVKSIEATGSDFDFTYYDKVPTTIFDVEVIHTFKGTDEDNLSVELFGGYDSEGRFFGWSSEGLSNCDNEYSLFEDDHYYFIVIETHEDGYNRVIQRRELVGYDETKTVSEQSTDIIEILTGYGFIEEE